MNSSRDGLVTSRRRAAGAGSDRAWPRREAAVTACESPSVTVRGRWQPWAVGFPRSDRPACLRAVGGSHHSAWHSPTESA